MAFKTQIAHRRKQQTKNERFMNDLSIYVCLLLFFACRNHLLSTSTSEVLYVMPQLFYKTKIYSPGKRSLSHYKLIHFDNKYIVMLIKIIQTLDSFGQGLKQK